VGRGIPVCEALTLVAGAFFALSFRHAGYRGPPMILANMSGAGVRSLWVVRDLCHHEAVINVDRYGDAVPVPAFGPRMSARRGSPL